MSLKEKEAVVQRVPSKNFEFLKSVLVSFLIIIIFLFPSNSFQDISFLLYAFIFLPTMIEFYISSTLLGTVVFLLFNIKTRIIRFPLLVITSIIFQVYTLYIMFNNFVSFH